MEVQQFTTIGNRTENQDFIAYETIGDEAGIFVVADGMGGYENGAIASEIVAKAIVESILSNWSIMDSEILLKEAIEFANESLALKRLALDCKKMGSCISVLLIKDETAFLTWFGDSRIYVYRNGIERYHTRDHSAVMELSQIKALTTKDIEKYENIVTRSIMGSESLDPMELQKMEYQKGDVFILCTDGLHKSISLPIRMPEDFILQLTERGERYSDNASCLLIKV